MSLLKKLIGRNAGAKLLNPVGAINRQVAGKIGLDENLVDPSGGLNKMLAARLKKKKDEE